MKKSVHIIFMSYASIHGYYLIKIVRFAIEIYYVSQYLQFHRVLWLLSMNVIMMKQHRLLSMKIIKLELRTYEREFEGENCPKLIDVFFFCIPADLLFSCLINTSEVRNIP